MLGGSDDAYVREVSFCDPISRKMTMFSVNLSLSRASPVHASCVFPPDRSLTLHCRPCIATPAEYLQVLESISYAPSTSHPASSTLFAQKAEILARSQLWKSVDEKLEKMSLERFISNAAKGKEGFEGVLSRLWNDDKETVVAASVRGDTRR